MRSLHRHVEPRRGRETIATPNTGTDATDRTKTPWRSGRGDQNETTIAVVDDEPDLRSIYQIILRKLGYDTLLASDGEEFLRETKEDPDSFKLVLMDYRMPGMNGLEVSKRAIELKPGLKVIIASADDSIRHEAIGSGFGFILKPFSKAELVRAIEGALRGP